MKSLYKFIVTPKSDRYSNTAKVGGKDLILNTDIYNHKYISRNAIVLATPTAFKTPIKEGMEVVIHHNVFRRWHDIRGNEANSSSFITEDRYGCYVDQIYMYKEDGEWKGFDEYCFVIPAKNDEKFDIKNEKTTKGIIEVSNSVLKSMGVVKGSSIGFLPSSEYEFVVDGKLMYKMSWRDVCVKYEDNKFKPYQPELAEF